MVGVEHHFVTLRISHDNIAAIGPQGVSDKSRGHRVPGIGDRQIKPGRDQLRELVFVAGAGLVGHGQIGGVRTDTQGRVRHQIGGLGGSQTIRTDQDESTGQPGGQYAKRSGLQQAAPFACQ